MHSFHPSCKVREWLFGALKDDCRTKLGISGQRRDPEKLITVDIEASLYKVGSAVSQALVHLREREILSCYIGMVASEPSVLGPVSLETLLWVA
jgi:hypothetical protein